MVPNQPVAFIGQDKGQRDLGVDLGQATRQTAQIECAILEAAGSVKALFRRGIESLFGDMDSLVAKQVRRQAASCLGLGKQQSAVPPEEAQASRGVGYFADEMRQVQADSAAPGLSGNGGRWQVIHQDPAFRHRSVVPGGCKADSEGPVAQGRDAKRAAGVSLDEVRHHACVGKSVVGHDVRIWMCDGTRSSPAAHPLTEPLVMPAMMKRWPRR